MKKAINKFGSVLAFVGAVLFGASAWASSQTTAATVQVGETKTGITSGSNVSGSTRTWSEKTPAAAAVAKVELTSYSNVLKPTISVTGVGAGYTTYVAENNATSGTDASYTFTCNITVTDSKSEGFSLGVGKEVEKTCTYTGKFNSSASDRYWSGTSSDSSVATVSVPANSTDASIVATIRGVTAGTAKITVKNDYMTYTYNVTVKPLETGAAQTVKVGSSIELVTAETNLEKVFVTADTDAVNTYKKMGKAGSQDYAFAGFSGSKPGTATVSVEESNKIVTYFVTVTEAKSFTKTIDLDQTDSVTLNSTAAAKATWKAAFETAVDGFSLGSASASNVASFNPVVKATKLGSAKVVVTATSAAATPNEFLKYTYTVNAIVLPSESRTSDVLANTNEVKTVTCPGNCSDDKSANWTVKVADETVATVSVRNPTNATKRPAIEIRAKKSGATTITVSTSDDPAHTWTVNLTIAASVYGEFALENTESTTDTETLDCESAVAGDWEVASSDMSLVRVALISGADAKKCQVKATAVYGGEGHVATITVKNPAITYTYQVTVKGPFRPVAGQESIDFTFDEKPTKIYYKGASEVREMPATDPRADHDLLLVFTNVNDLASLEVPSPYLMRAQVLAVAGGGAGGSQARAASGAGGGGAGGYHYNANALMSAGLYSIAVGAGGEPGNTQLTASPGGNGGNSVVTNSVGIIVASSVGGGGGGASVPNDKVGGMSGGSGGGGAWVLGKATQGGHGSGGTARDGQGNAGGTPTVFNNGGGGGGAGGAGGADGTAGVGQTCAITGESVVYAQGGAGGKKDVITPAVNGEGYGFGGQGGNGGFGGFGGQGIVVVRIMKVYQNVQVPFPYVAEDEAKKQLGTGGLYTDTASPNLYPEFQFRTGDDAKTGTNYWFRPFNPNAKFKASDGYEYTYADVTNYIDGVATTNCYKETRGDKDVIVGSGHHQFVIYLKDGYSWKDGSAYGSTLGRLVDWRITDDLLKVDATIKVEKAVSWGEDGSNAVVTITSHSTPAQNPVTPNVLFIGTMCTHHDLTPETIGKSINAISAKANVKWFLWNNSSHTDNDMSAYHEAGSPVFNVSGSGSSAVVTEIDGQKRRVTMSDTNHQALGKFLETLANELETNKYDYVVLEFDGSRIFPDYTGTSTADVNIQKRAAAALAPFYADERVIWVVDDNANVESWSFPDGNNTYYRPMSYAVAGQNVDNNATLGQYKGLVALLDPKHYKADATSLQQLATTYYTGNLRRARNNGGSQDTVSGTYYANDTNTNQVGYSECETLVRYLDLAIKPVAYNLSFNDKIMADVGLTLTAMDFYIATNELDATAQTGWMKMAYWEPSMGTDVDCSLADNYRIDGLGRLNINFSQVDSLSNHVEVVMTNMLIETWAKIDISIVDDGTFKTSVDATYNPVTGQYEKNPNEGKAHVAMVEEDGTETTVKGEAATSAAWKFDFYNVSVRSEFGEIYLNGRTNCIAYAEDSYDASIDDYSTLTGRVGFAEGYSPIVAYRGLAGFAIESLYIDGNPEVAQGDSEVFWMFNKLADHHSVEVIYTNYVNTITATPTTNVYDAAGHLFKVEWDVLKEYFDYPIEARFSTEKDGVYTNAADFIEFYGQDINGKDLKDAGDHPVYYKVFAYQPGYGETIYSNGWISVGEQLIGEGICTNTVLQRDLFVTAAFTNREANTSFTQDQLDANSTVRFDAATETTGFAPGEDSSVLDMSGLKYGYGGYVPESSNAGTYDLTVEGIRNKGVENYNIIVKKGQFAVGTWIFEVNDVPQTDELFKRKTADENADNGVESIDKYYDGIPTNIIVNVTWPSPFPGSEENHSKISYTTNLNLLGETEWTTNNIVFTNVIEKTAVWYKLEDGRCNTATNLAYVTIRPRPIWLESATAEKMFDGEALYTNYVFVAEGSPYGWVPGEGMRYQTITKQTDVAVVSNNFQWVSNYTGTVRSNYDIKLIPGVLTITQAPMVIGGKTYPIDPDEGLRPSPGTPGTTEVGSNGVANVIKEYDGTGTNIVVKVNTPKSGRTVLYSTNGTDWVEQLLLTNAVPGQGVWFTVVEEGGKHNYGAVTNIAYVTINPREATVTAADATKVYDGTPLKTNDFTTANFVKDEGIASVEMVMPDSQITHVGTTNNVIDRSSLVPLEGTLLSNYKLTYNKGLLEVTKRHVTVTSTNQFGVAGQDTLETDISKIVADGMVAGERFTYEATATKSGPEGSVDATFVCKDGTAKVDDYDIEYKYGKLTLGSDTIIIDDVPQDKVYERGLGGIHSVTNYYDGTGHSINVNVTYPDPSLLDIFYSLDGNDWSETKPLFTNVVDDAVVWCWVREKAPGGTYSPCTNSATVTVLRRPITVKANDKEMTYGKDAPSLNGEFSVSNKVADTYVVSLDYTNEVFNAGVCTNAIVTNAAIKVMHETLGDVTGCYDITFIPGTLTVKQAEFTGVTATPVVKTYDGRGTNVTVTVTNITNAVIEFLDPKTGEWTSELEYVDVRLDDGKVAPYTVTYRVIDPAGNYATKTGESKVTINPRKIRIKPDPATERIDVILAELEQGVKREWPAQFTYVDNGMSISDEVKALLDYSLDISGDVFVDNPDLWISASVPEGKTIQGNYEIVTDRDTLIVYDKGTIEYTVECTTNMYNGAGWKIVVNATTNDIALPPECVLYAFEDSSTTNKSKWGWQPYDNAKCPAQTNVTEGAGMPIWFWIHVNDEWQDIIAHADIVVTQALLKVMAKSTWKNIGDEDPKLTAEVKGLVEADKDKLESVKYEVSREEGEAVGHYAIIPAGAESQFAPYNNYRVEYVNGDFEIKDLNIKYTAPNVEVPYDGTNHFPVVTVDQSVKVPQITFIDENGVEYGDVPPSYTNVGSHVVTFIIEDKTPGSERIPVTNKVTVTITRRPIVIATTYQEKFYDGLPLTSDRIEIGGSGYAPGEEFAYTYTNITNVGKCPAGLWLADNPAKNTYLSNYDVKQEYDWLVIKPNENQIVVESGSLYREYTGERFTAGCTTNGLDLVQEGHTLRVEMDGVGIIEPGLSNNTFRVWIEDGDHNDVTANYPNLVAVTGKLEVVSAKFKDSDFAKIPVDVKYNGDPTNVVVSIIKTQGVKNAEIKYSADGLSWGENPTFTDVVSTGVYFAVTADFHNAYTSSVPVSLKIRPREITFTSKDGMAASNEAMPLVTDLETIEVGGDGYAKNEKFDFSEPASLDHVGSIPAGFTATPNAASGAKAENYNVTPKFGTLIVYADNALTFIATNDTFVFNGKAQSNHGYTVKGLKEGDSVKSVTFDPLSSIRYPSESPVTNRIVAIELNAADPSVYAVTNFVTGVLTMENAKFTDVIAYGTNTVYDGKGYSIAVVPPVTVDGLDATITYSETGDDATFVEWNPSYTNASERTVWYKVEKNGYDPYIGSTNVVITRRAVTIYSGSLTNDYSGLAISNGTVSVKTGEGFLDLAEGDSLDAEASHSTVELKNAGAIGNAFVYKIVNGRDVDVTKNYDVNPVPGELRVNQKSVKLTYDANDRAFDATTNATYKIGSATFDGVLDGEKLVFDPAAANMKFYFATADIGIDKPVTAVGYDENKCVKQEDGTLRSNYKITFEKMTKATITPAEMPDPEEPSNPEDPEEERKDPGAGPFKGPDLDDPRTPPLPGDAYAYLSDYDVITNYDGKAHTFDTNLLFKALAHIAETNGYFKLAYEVEYSLTGAENTWTNEPFAWVNVTDTPTSFWYRVTATSNLTSKIHAVGVTILPRELKGGLYANNVTNCYSHAAPPLADHGWTGPIGLVTPDYVASVAFDWTNKSAVATLPVGTYAGSITTNKLAQQPIVISNATEDVTANYAFDFYPGALVITNAVITPLPPPGPDDPDPAPLPDDAPYVFAHNVVMEYTGTNGTNVVGIAKGLVLDGTEEEILYSTNEVDFVEWEALQFTNVFYDAEHDNCVTSQKVWFTVNAPNYDVVTNFAWVTITPCVPNKGPNGPFVDAEDAVMVYTGTNGTNIVGRARNYQPEDVKVTCTYCETEDGTWVPWESLQYTNVFYDAENNVTSQKVYVTVKAPNYETVVTNAYVTILPASIESKGPFPPPPPGPEPEPPAGDGPMCYAYNVEMEYTGTNGTNVVGIVANLVPASTETKILYSTNEVDFVEWEALQFTNVFYDAEHDNCVTSQKVWFTVNAPNYAEMTNCAYVTITPCVPNKGPNGPFVDAEDAVMVYTGTNGTNIVGRARNYQPGDVKVTYTYCETEDGTYVPWESLQYTNVFYDAENNVTSQKVYVTVKAPNYETVVTNAYVTILPASIESKGPFPPPPPGPEPEPPAGDGPMCYAYNVEMEYTGTNGTNVVGIVANLVPASTETKILYSTNEVDFVEWEALQFTNVFYDAEHDNCVTSQKVWFTVNAPNYAEMTNCAYVTITPCVPNKGPNGPFVDAEDAVMVYTGTNGTNIVGRAHNYQPGDVKVTYTYCETEDGTYVPWESLQYTNVFYDADNNVTSQKVYVTVKAPNYETVVTNAYVTILPASIESKGPFPPPPPGPEPEPPAGDGPMCYAYNVEMEYTGTNGTNVVGIAKGLVPASTEPEIRYSTNEVDFVEWEALQFTNVFYDAEHDNCVTSQKVWFTVNAPNYAEMTNCAYVTITPACVKIWNRDPDDPPVSQDPENPIDPGDPFDVSGSTNGVRNVVKEYDGLPTNIDVNVVWPTEGVKIHYTTNLESAVWFETLELVEPMLTNKVWYVIEAENFQPFTNFAYVTIWKAEVEPTYPEDLDIPEEDQVVLEESLKSAESNDINFAERPYIKYKLTVSRTNDLDTVSDLARTTRTYRAVAMDWRASLLEFAEEESLESKTNASLKVVHSEFYDVILERIYKPVTEYRWREWDDIGDPALRERVPETAALIAVPLPFEEPENMEIFGVFTSHSNDTTWVHKDLPTKANAKEGEQYYEIKRDADNPKKGTVIVHLREFCPVLIAMKDMYVHAEFDATLDWVYYSGKYVARLNVTNVNDRELIWYEPGSMKFCFKDRSTDNMDGKLCLWNPTKSEKIVATTKIGDEDWEYVSLPDPGTDERGGWTMGKEFLIGPAVGATGLAIARAMKTAPVVAVGKRWAPTDENAAPLGQPTDGSAFVCYLKWISNGKEMKQAIVPQSASAQVKKTLAAARPRMLMSAAPTPDGLNLAAAMNVPYAEGSDMSCEITDFAVADGLISGRVVTKSGDASGTPSGTASVTLICWDDLNGQKTEIPVEVDADGWFSIQTTYRFFQVRIGVAVELFR